MIDKTNGTPSPVVYASVGFIPYDLNPGAWADVSKAFKYIQCLQYYATHLVFVYTDIEQRDRHIGAWYAVYFVRNNCGDVSGHACGC